MAFAEIEKFLDTPVKRYSSGMYVRLAFAVAAHLEPEILLVDEVLAVGDAEFQKKCLGKMGDVAKEGRTVLFVSHNMAAVATLCGTCVWLDEGHVKAVSNARVLIDSYLAGVSQTDGAHLDLVDSRRASPLGDKFRFTSIELNGGGPVTSGMPLEIELGFAAYENLTDVSFGVGFSTLEGARIITLRSDFGSKRSVENPTPKLTSVKFSSAANPSSTVKRHPLVTGLAIEFNASKPELRAEKRVLNRPGRGIRAPCVWETPARSKSQ